MVSRIFANVGRSELDLYDAGRDGSLSCLGIGTMAACFHCVGILLMSNILL